MGQFEASVSQWVRESADRMEAVWKQSVQDTINEANRVRGEGGRMRVDTGFLRASGRASTKAMPRIDPGARPAEGGVYAYNGSEIAAILLGAELGQTIFYGYTASYAGYREYGANGQPPDAFVRGAVRQWGRFVNKNARELRSRAQRR